MIKKKKIKTITNIHEFFYEKSNFKVGASENNMQLVIKVIEKEQTSNNYLEKNSKKYTSVSNKKFKFFEELIKNNLKFNITKKLIYSLSVFGFLLIFGFQLFFILQSKKNESNITDKSTLLEKDF